MKLTLIQRLSLVKQFIDDYLFEYDKPHINIHNRRYGKREKIYQYIKLLEDEINNNNLMVKVLYDSGIVLVGKKDDEIEYLKNLLKGSAMEIEMSDKNGMENK